MLADLAHALRTTDMTWPRTADEDFCDHRALAWSRCRDYLPEWPEHTGLPEQRRRQLVEDFLTDIGSDDEVSRSLAELFLDYGDGYIGAGALCWSPGEVMLLLTDWLPRKAVLDADQRNALPFVLRRWLTFALTQQGVDRQWISLVVDAVDNFTPEFQDAFDDETAWGPANRWPQRFPREASTSPTATPSTTPFGNSTPNNSPTDYCPEPSAVSTSDSHVVPIPF